MKEKDYVYFKEEIKKLLDKEEIRKLDNYIQHGRVTRLEHSIYVAYSSYAMCRQLKLRVDYESLIRGAMLHDYFLYDWHEKQVTARWHGLHHPAIALRNAKELTPLNKVEQNIIRSHMWPLTLLHVPLHRESIMVSIADKLCAMMETVSWNALKPKFMC